MNEIKVRDVMTHLVVMAYEKDPLQKLAGRLVRNRISGVPVVRDGKVVGVVSEMDIAQASVLPAKVDYGMETTDTLLFLLRTSADTTKHARTAADVMSKPAVTIGPDESLFSAARVMDRRGVKRLPVVDDDGYLVGIISRGDLVRAMTRSDRDIREDVMDAIFILGPENFDDLDIRVTDGVVSLSGSCDRRSTRDIAVDVARRVTGVSEVVDRLEFETDDSTLKPVRNPLGARDIGSADPWAVGPLVKGA